MCTSAAAGCLFSLVHCLHCTTPAPKKASSRTRKSRFAFFWIFPSLPPSLFPSVSPHPAFPGHGKTACIRKIFCRLRSDRGGAMEWAYLMKRLTTDFGRTGDKISSRAENPSPPLSLPCAHTLQICAHTLLVCIHTSARMRFRKRHKSFFAANPLRLSLPPHAPPSVCRPTQRTACCSPEHYSSLFLAVRRVFGKKTPETRRDEKIS